jgi:hypothetical protein
MEKQRGPSPQHLMNQATLWVARLVAGKDCFCVGAMFLSGLSDIRPGTATGAEERGAGSHDCPGFCCCWPCNGTPPCRLDHHAFHQKKMPVTTPTPLNSKIRHAEKTRTKNTPELYCCYCCCYHLHNAASSCRRLPTRAPHSSQQLPALSPPHFRTKQDDDDDKNTTAKLNARYYHPSILTSEYNTDQC